MSEKERHKERRETLRDIDLLKVKVYADQRHAIFTLLTSFILAFFITVSVFLYTLFYQGLIFLDAWIGGLILVWCFTIVSLYVVINLVYKSDFKRISDMIEMIKQGKELPILEKLGRKELY